MSGTYRYEAAMEPEMRGGCSQRIETIVSSEPLQKGQRVKVGSVWWVVTTLLPHDDTRPHLGDKIVTSTKPPKS